jgi:LuxR family transcriptional regulator of csgAB operon
MGVELEMKGLLPNECSFDRTVCGLVLVGRSSLQYNLLARLLERDIGVQCVVASIDDPRLTGGMLGTVCLLDVGTIPVEDLEKQFECLCSEASKLAAVALINADPSINFDCLLHWQKVQGLFYRDTSEEQFVRGVRALLGNECWLPRKMLARHLELTRGPNRLFAPKDVGLTRKETETLRAMVSGAKNSDIAHTLHVSPHTVKTHIYNLFRKINVRNRVQAVSWAVMNFDHSIQNEADL